MAEADKTIQEVTLLRLSEMSLISNVLKPSMLYTPVMRCAWHYKDICVR